MVNIGKFGPISCQFANTIEFLLGNKTGFWIWLWN